MQYTVVKSEHIDEFDVDLMVGQIVEDGDLEPDLTAELVSRGVLEPVAEEGVEEA